MPKGNRENMGHKEDWGDTTSGRNGRIDTNNLK